MPAPAVYILAIVGTIAAGIAFKEVRMIPSGLTTPPDLSLVSSLSTNLILLQRSSNGQRSL
jgi:hypothetical protein